MSETVDTGDDEVTPVIEFVGRALGGDASCYRGPAPYRPEDVEVPPLSRERPLHGTDVVPALAHATSDTVNNFFFM